MLTLAVLQFQTVWGNTGNVFLRDEELKPLQYALQQIVNGGPARQGAGAVVTLIIADSSDYLLRYMPSSIIETMTTSGMKD